MQLPHSHLAATHRDTKLFPNEVLPEALLGVHSHS